AGQPMGIQGRAHYDVQESDGAVVHEIRLHLDGGEVSPAALQQVKNRALKAVALKLNNGHTILDSSGEPKRLQFNVVFVDDPAGSHASIKVRRGEGISEDTEWYTNEAGVIYVHEILHHFGLLDEYVDPEVIPRESATAPGVHEDGSLMALDDVPDPHRPGDRMVRPDLELKQRHIDELALNLLEAVEARKDLTPDDDLLLPELDGELVDLLKVAGPRGKDRKGYRRLDVPGLWVRLFEAIDLDL
ncbi:MAG: hypothetical protein L0206_16420, partial [Actinobacteria bacterium]|nr:hypothetical protein [Actinomycetota bacterium]